jgi:hypothetical protein
MKHVLQASPRYQSFQLWLLTKNIIGAVTVITSPQKVTQKSQDSTLSIHSGMSTAQVVEELSLGLPKAAKLEA